MVGDTQVADVPEPSESRYWCISGKLIRNYGAESGMDDLPIATLLLGSLMLPNTSPLPDDTQAEE
jgi:hypothetical protein